VIGYYAHHHGAGHVNRALSIARQLGDDLTILSSAARPAGWTGGWLALPRDTDLPPIDPEAQGALHWAPVGSAGLASRMALISSWLLTARPDVFVVDVSVEVAALVRLHGIRVVVVGQPGLRVDDAHTLGYHLADAIIGCWPESVHPVQTRDGVPSRLEAVGGISRIPIARSTGVRGNLIAVINGSGGRGQSALDLVVDDARRQLPGYEWAVLSGASQNEVAGTLAEAALAFGHCGENVVAEIAAARVPAVLVPEQRPFDEQYFLAREIARCGLPARIVEPGQRVEWPAIIRDLSASNPHGWSAWVDGDAAARAARIIERVAGRGLQSAQRSMSGAA
jgi:hypothetical protein